MIGTYARNAENTISTDEIYNSTTHCVSDTLNNNSSKEKLIASPDTLTIQKIEYSDIDCKDRVSIEQRIFKYKLRDTFNAGTVENTGSGMAETGDEVEATKMDMMFDKLQLYCDTDSCVNDYTIAYYSLDPYNDYCLIEFGKSKWIDVTECSLFKGLDFNKDLMYMSVYYSQSDDKLYISSDYANPDDGQPDDKYSGSSSDTRERYINISTWYDKLSDEY
jgi:hypothetical protein